MKTMHITLLSLAIGATTGYSIAQHMFSQNMDMAAAEHAKPSIQEPLYWVAPMDPNYQRDKPGKSPMGMDLVPVYADDNDQTTAVGTVTINSAVENNLGVKTESVTIEKLSPHIKTVGYVAFDDSKLWQTNVRVAGWVEKLYINAVGEQVNKGDVLFEFYSPELVKAQEELLNAYNTGRKGLIKGATERLIALGVDRQQIKRIIRQGRASQTVEIKAMANGIIASLNIREGGYLSPSQLIISAGPIDEVWVDAEIFERQAEWITTGTKATMTLDALSGQQWQGRVDYVYPILDPNTRTLRVRLKFSNHDHLLKPNMFANITLQPVTDKKVVTVPRSAVIRSGGMTRVVLSKGNGQYRSARIKVGREAQDRIEIRKGLTQNDTVVTSAQFMIDSESSLTADLSRINGVVNDKNSAWVTGSISMLMPDFGMITLSHQAVTKWGWSAGEMNFSIPDDMDLSAFKETQHVRFLIKKDGSDYALAQLENEGEL